MTCAHCKIPCQLRDQVTVALDGVTYSVRVTGTIQLCDRCFANLLLAGVIELDKRIPPPSVRPWSLVDDE